MKRFFTLTFVIALFALLLMPVTAQAQSKAAPRLDLKTTAVTMSYVSGPLTPPSIKTPVVFGNGGSAPLRWWLYVGSDFGGCAVESPVKWFSISPAFGTLKPHTNTDAVLQVDPKSLEPGVHEVTLCMATNDPFSPMVQIPFAVHVK